MFSFIVRVEVVMKRFLLLLAASSLLFINQSNSQGSPWITQSYGLTTAPWYDVRLAAVSNTVCWGLHFRTGSQYTRTTDGGAQWTAGTIPGAPASWRGSGITALDANTAWVLMHDPSSPTSGGAFKTTDGGASWTHQTTAFSGTGGFPKIIHFYDASVGLCVGDANGGYWEIYRTTNGGLQWTRIDSVNIPLPDAGETTSFFGGSASNSFWFSGGDGGFSFWHLYRTTDRGLTWVRRNPGGGTRFPTFASTTHGICAGWVPSQEMRRTTDGGDTWSTEDMSFLPFTPLLFGYVPGTVNSYVLTNGVRPGFSSTAGCAYTTNGGDTWNNVDLGVSRGLASFASPTTGWASGDFGTVYKWTGNVLVPPIPTAHLQLWLKAEAGVTLNGSTVSNWADQSGNGNNAIQSNTERQPLFVAGGLNGRPILRFDGLNDKLGFTGSRQMSQISYFLVFKNDSGAQGANPNNVLTFGAAGGGLGEQYFMLVRGLANIPDRIGIGVGTSNGIQANATNIAAYGAWRYISVITNQTIWSTTLRWNRNDASMVPVGSDVSISVPLGDPTGSGGGIGGADGVPLGTIVAKCDVAELIVYDTVFTQPERDSIEGYLCSKYGLCPTGVIERKGDLPERFVLEQNYPNPFNPSTKIKFSIPVGTGHAPSVLRVYDLLGREVATLVNEYLQPGSYEVTFSAEGGSASGGDARGLASGVYFYRLQSGEFMQTRRLLLLQ
jgi:hypothetical protein